ncbi:MAG: hypothetical protein L3J53_00825 [Proteobacteria bacterium]|nr:hypothetical protein [Pseudomonadota bacterium]
MKYPKIDSTYIWKKQHLRKYIAGVIGFSLLMPFVIFIGKKTEVGIPLKIIIALLPAIPFFLAMSAFLKNIKSMDELWKKIMSDALIMTAIITIGLSFSLGMLQVVDILEPFSVLYIYIFMMIVWPCSFAYFHIRYNGLPTHEE